MCPDSEHFGENPSLPKKAGLFLFGAAHPLVTSFWFLGDNVVYWKTKRKINDDLPSLVFGFWFVMPPHS
jgi:hypothetical protein